MQGCAELTSTAYALGDFARPGVADSRLGIRMARAPTYFGQDFPFNRPAMGRRPRVQFVFEKPGLLRVPGCEQLFTEQPCFVRTPGAISATGINHGR